jgi:hypothetical protein
MQGECAFWKSIVFDDMQDCQAVVLGVMDEMRQEEFDIVQGVCLPLEDGIKT